LGDCIYCGKPAGFWRTKHDECEQQHILRQVVTEQGEKRIVAEVLRAIKGSESFDELEKSISEIEKSCSVPNSGRKLLLIKGWETSVNQFLEDSILDEKEEQRLVEFKERFALSQSDLNRNGALTKTAKAAVLRDVLNGIIPKRVSVNENLPMNFQKGEQIVWAFPGADYLEDKARQQYVGGSQGVSIRVMKGVYYRVGAFKGQPVERTERVHVDTGWVVITNKHIYFAGPAKSLRIPYSKVVSFLPFNDGIGIIRDAANAKPQIFVTGDGWFSYNLVINLAQL
jgi:hypothetical protein